MRFSFAVIVFFLIALLQSDQFYKPADNGSKVSFSIKNFGIKTEGTFSKLSGEINFDPGSLEKSSFNVMVQAATINTDNSIRDRSLREEYFETEKFPEIRMVSKKIEKTNKTEEGFYYFTGNLIIKGVSREVSFPFKVENKGKNLIFTGGFTINRLDFGIGKKSTVLGSMVNISLSVSAQKI